MHSVLLFLFPKLEFGFLKHFPFLIASPQFTANIDFYYKIDFIIINSELI
jgi:hypothetical protein